MSAITETRPASFRPATTAVPLHPLLAQRWSPRAFDPTRMLDDAELAALLEAARWAPSANNIQPWRFIVGRRGDVTFATIADTLAGFNRAWAPDAAALVVAVAQTHVDGRDHPVAAYDLGGAVAHLTVQAHAEGLHVHQMGGFDRAALADALGIPAGFTPMTVVAVGHAVAPDALPDALAERERAPRERAGLDQVALTGWNQPLRLHG